MPPTNKQLLSKLKAIKRKEVSNGKLEDERKEKGFIHNTKFTPPKNSLPQITTFGPQQLPKPSDQLKESDAFYLFFDGLLDHIVTHTNEHLQKHNITTSPDSSTILQVTKEDIINYFACFFALGAVGCNDFSLAWTKLEKFDGLVGNLFVQTTMSKSRFVKIHRSFQANLEFIRDHVRYISNHLFIPSSHLSCDDQLQKYKGRGKHRSKIDRKADKTGLLAWELVSTFNYLHNIIFEYVLNETYIKDKIKIPKNEYYMQQLISPLPNNSFTFICDQGTLGGIKNAEYLNDKGMQFIMTCKKSRPSFLWNFLHKGINKREWKMVHNGKIMAISYYAKGDGKKKKIVNLLTNIEGADDTQVIREYDKKLKAEVEFRIPKVVTMYRKLHGSVDKRKQYESYVKSEIRQKYEWRSEMNDYLYALLTNAFIYYKNAKKLGKKYIIKIFVFKLCVQIRKVKATSKRVLSVIRNQSRKKIVYHRLTGYGGRTDCVVCKKQGRLMCDICPEKPCLHDGLCNLKYHNPNISIDEGLQHK